MSMWLVGSSISSTLGCCSISLPNSMRPRSPPDSTRTDFPASSPENSSWPSVARTIWSSSSGLRPLLHPVEHGQVGVEFVGLVLRVVAERGLLRPFDACRRRARGRRSACAAAWSCPTPLGPTIASRSPASSSMLQVLEQRLVDQPLARPLDLDRVAMQLLLCGRRRSGCTDSAGSTASRPRP